MSSMQTQSSEAGGSPRHYVNIVPVMLGRIAGTSSSTSNKLELSSTTEKNKLLRNKMKIRVYIECFNIVTSSEAYNLNLLSVLCFVFYYAKLSPKPSFSGGAEVAIFSTNPAIHPLSHQEKYERAIKTAYYLQNESCKYILVGPRKVFAPDPNPKNSSKEPKRSPNGAEFKRKKIGQ